MLGLNEKEGTAFADGRRLSVALEAGTPFGERQEAAVLLEKEEGAEWLALPPTSTSAAVDPSLSELLKDQAERFEARLGRYPGSPLALNNLGLLHLKSGNFERAAGFFQEALERSQDFVPAELNLARAYLLAGQPVAAGDVYRRVLQKHPANVSALFNLAAICLQQHRLDEAETYLSRAIEADPENPSAYNNRGILWGMQRRSREAIRDLRKALRIDVRDVAAHNNIGVCFSMSGSYRKAIQHFKAALAVDPRDLDVRRNLAAAYLVTDRTSEALPLLEKYVRDRPEDPVGRVFLAQGCFKSQRFDESERHLRRGLQVAQNAMNNRLVAGILNNLGVVARGRGRWEKAKELFFESLRLRSDRVTLRNLALLQLDDGNLAEADSLTQRLIREHSDDCFGLTLRGAFLVASGQYPEAAEHLERAITCDPSDVRPYLVLTIAVGDGLARYDEVIPRLRECLRRAPRDTALMNNLAYCYLMTGNASAARSILERVKDAQEAHVLATRGLLMLKEGNSPEAARLYNQAASSAGSRELQNQFLQKKALEFGRQELEQGSSKAARRHLQKVLKLKTATRLFVREAQRLLAEA